MNNNKPEFFLRLACCAGTVLAASFPVLAIAAGSPEPAAAWWVWPLALFIVCFVLGMIAVPAGIGGGVLFVPIVSGFFPFHLDFVRGAGLLVALASALAAGPGLLRSGLADLRLGLPLTLLASAAAIVGALVGLALPVAIVETALGIMILCIAALMWRANKAAYSDVPRPDVLGAALHISGGYPDHAPAPDIPWQV